MKLTAKKAEVDTIAAILASDTYESEEDMAKAVLSASFELLRQRDLWSVAHYVGDSNRPTFFGVEPTENAARKFAATLGGGRALLVPIHSAGSFEENTQAAEAAWEVRRTTVCANCGHEKWAHEKRRANGKLAPSAKSKAPCSATCKCEQFIAG